MLVDRYDWVHRVQRVLMQPVSTKIATFFYPEIKAGLEMELREVPNPPHVELGIKKKKKDFKLCVKPEWDVKVSFLVLRLFFFFFLLLISILHRLTSSVRNLTWPRSHTNFQHFLQPDLQILQIANLQSVFPLIFFSICKYNPYAAAKYALICSILVYLIFGF